MEAGRERYTPIGKGAFPFCFCEAGKAVMASGAKEQ
jgi:hypothetical protein